MAFVLTAALAAAQRGRNFF